MESEINWLYELQRFGSRLSLERIEQIMELLGNPHKDMKFIHIAGTNGKGSTAAMVASILQEAGFRTGLYTSPHLIQFNERIQINGVELDNEDSKRLIKKIRKVMEQNNVSLTFFEFVTTMAFLYFYEQKVDYVVAEVGLGGKYDATNIIDPVITVITNIDLDHTHILGDDKLTIAKEKAGIVKKGVPVITAVQDQEVIDYLSDLCEELGCSFSLVKPELVDEIKSLYKIGLKGEHQLWNAACAYLVCKKLDINDHSIREGLKNVVWLGRIDIRKWHSKRIIIDSAHNEAGMDWFTRYLKENDDTKKVFVIGFSKDKDIEKMITKLSNVINDSDSVFVTKSDFKPADVFYVSDIVSRVLKRNDVKCFEHASDAVLEALDSNSGEKDIVITGSIYLIGKILQQETDFL